MKNIYYSLLFLLFTNLGFSQTYIPMPTGYGLIGPNGFVSEAATPFYSHDGFLYCSSILQSSSPLAISIFKVNEATNVVTAINTVLSIDINFFQPSNFQIFNSEIYFLISGGVYKINPISNNFVLVTNGIGNEFAILNNKIFGSSGYIYDLVSQTGSSLMNPENPIQTISINNMILHNNSIFGVRLILNGSSGNQYESKIYRILDANSVQLLYTNPLNGFYEGFDDNKPIVFNNKLLFRFYKVISNTGSNSVESYDLNNNSINTIYNYEPIGLQNTHYVYNDNIYFRNSSDQTLVSNGISPATVTNIPTIINESGGGFAFNPNTPTFGLLINTPTILCNNKIFGCKRVLNNASGNYEYEVRKTDGTLNGTSLIYNGTGSADRSVVVNNNLYFFKYTAVGGFGELIQYNDTNQQTTTVFSGFMQSYRFVVNNSIFFYGAVNSIYGLYKLDTTTLSENNFEKSNKISLFTNPTNSILNIETQETINAIKIIDIAGRKNNITILENYKIDVSNLQNGVYFVEVTTNNGVLKEKFIKQ